MSGKKNIPLLPQAEVIASVFQASDLILWMTNEQHRCIFVNQAALRYTGTSTAGEFLDLNWLNLIHPEDQERCSENRELLLKQPKNFRQDYRIRGPKGEWRWALDTTLARYDSSGRFRGYLGLVVDITEQKTAELELREQQKRLESQILEISEREQRRIGRDLHDGLSQKLLALALHCRILENELKRQGRREKGQAGKILREVNQAIRHTREVSRALAPVSLDEDGLKEALRELADWARENFKVSIRLAWSRKVTAPNLDDAVHLYRIVQEAITNSVRHGRAKNIRVTFRQGKPGHCQLRIEDDGKGYRSKRGPAKGMGIPTMKYRAKRLSGTFSIAKQGPKGTAVRIDFPQRSGTRQ